MGKKSQSKEVEASDGFEPIELIQPSFVQISHVCSLSDPMEKYLFYDTEQGEVEGYVQRHDRRTNGEPYLLGEIGYTFLSVFHKRLNNVTLFKKI